MTNATQQPPLTVDQIFGYLIEGKFRLFKNDEMMWDAYAGADGDDAFYTDPADEAGWTYILSREDNNISAEVYNEDFTARRFTVQFGAWEEV